MNARCQICNKEIRTPAQKGTKYTCMECLLDRVKRKAFEHSHPKPKEPNLIDKSEEDENANEPEDELEDDESEDE